MQTVGHEQAYFLHIPHISTLTVKGKFVEITTTTLHKVQNSDYKSTDRFLLEKCYMLLSANQISGLSSSELSNMTGKKAFSPIMLH